MKNAAIAIVVIIVLAGLGFLLLRGTANKGTTATSSQSQSSSTSSNTTTSSQNTITYDAGKFSPNPITVKSGDTVTIMNKSSDEIQVNSEPHPAHTDNNELNIGSIGPGETRSFTVTKKGTWGYHNHLSPSEKGTIIVQ